MALLPLTKANYKDLNMKHYPITITVMSVMSGLTLDMHRIQFANEVIKVKEESILGGVI